MTRALLLAQLATTLPLAGLIWTIQVVHYPLFARVGAPGFAAYHAEHAARITWLVGPLMLVELGAALAWFRWPIERAPTWYAPAMAALVGVAWVTTACGSVPAHAQLELAFDRGAYDRLVASNWARTAAWSLRAALLLWLTSRELPLR
jgi:hypothetical protein